MRKKNSFFILLTIIIALALIAATWFAPIAIGHSARYSLTLLWLILSIGTVLFLYVYRGSHLPKSDRQSQVLKNIHAKIQQAISSWRKQVSFTERLTLPSQPWHFLLGTNESGKTSLLANSGLSLHSSHSSKVDASKTTRNLQFWSCKNNLFVDIPGDWFAADENSTDEERFHHLLQLTGSYRKNLATTQVIQVIDFNKIISKEPEKWIQESELISKQLQFMHDWNPKSEITLAINKADCIPGFEEFFSHLSQEDRKQTCGVGLQFDDNQPILDSLSAQLNAFADQVNAQTIQKLHRERNLNTRDAMKNFPFQVQQLMSSLFQLLESMPIAVIKSVKGVYLTSCTQEQAAATSFSGDGMDQLPIQLTTGDKKKPAVYFVESLFSGLTETKQTQVENKPLWRGEYSHIAIACVVLATAITSLHIGYQNSVTTLTQLSQSLITNSAHPITSLPDWLNKLNRLESIRQSLTDDHHFDARWLGLTAVNSLASSTESTYNKLLHGPFKQYVITQISNQLKADITNGSSSLFYDLATYLRLTSTTIPADKIIPWFNLYWSGKYPNNPDEVSLLISNLSNLFEQDFNYKADTALTAKAKQLLENSPPSQIIFMMLATKLSQTKQPVDINQPGLINKPMLIINPLFLLSRYNDIVNVEIPKLAKELTRDNWVLNKPIFENLSSEHSEELIRSAQQLYLKAFSQSWRDAFNNLNINQTTSLDADLQLSSYFSDFNSGVWQKLQAIINFLLVKNNLGISEKKYWSDIRNNLSRKNNQKLLIASLKENSSYLRKILYTNNPNESAFQAAKLRMMKNLEANPLKILLTLGNITPKPVTIWLNKLSQQSWKQMLQMTANYINTGWETTIYATYAKTIENRYPIFADSEDDITINDFNHFFGVGGAVQQFYANYLNGFVNTHQSYWTLKSIQGETIPIQRTALDAIIRGSLIQKMFYKKDKTKPLIGFALTPIRLGNHVRRIRFDIDGQTDAVTPAIARTFKASWPGAGNQIASIVLMTNTETYKINKTGPWAWLRLLQAATIKTTNKLTDFTVTFNLSGNSATFALQADNRINPYLPGLVSDFRIPKNLSVQADKAADR